jgi:hypothetical protein
MATYLRSKIDRVKGTLESWGIDPNTEAIAHMTQGMASIEKEIRATQHTSHNVQVSVDPMTAQEF